MTNKRLIFPSAGAALLGLMLTATAISNQHLQDTRTARLEAFLSEQRSPMAAYAHEFVQVADKHGLDWRLLPGIAIIESSGGKYCRNQNAFGWANGDVKFRSLNEGIHIVGERLAKAPVYASKNTVQKLRVYNTSPSYARAVLSVMNHIEKTSSSS